ncbi:hypothetical protein [Subtercola lobariae]|uniref:Uncharacterized protein n=1 Tax=Subtercola lobariae TaxID=1588641 RepID=A0A917B095_9MICO|nr:hypothetical protein [Subtercola lobariae]GGF11901.1 hypothetical protein GCM10011399_02240 [Subtercola lobariae]
MATVGKMKLADAPFSVDTPGSAATLALGADGLHFTIDVGRALPQGEGTFDIHWRTSVPDLTLAGFPGRSISLAPGVEGTQNLLRWM